MGGGRSEPLSPSDVLAEAGPCVPAVVSLLRRAGREASPNDAHAPATASGFALIDTGASSTSVDEKAVQELGQPSVDVARIASALEPSAVRSVYPISISLEGLPFPFIVPRAIGAELRSQGLLVLLGRDVLQYCTLFYNGLTGQITLAI